VGSSINSIYLSSFISAVPGDVVTNETGPWLQRKSIATVDLYSVATSIAMRWEQLYAQHERQFVARQPSECLLCSILATLVHVTNRYFAGPFAPLAICVEGCDPLSLKRFIYNAVWLNAKVSLGLLRTAICRDLRASRFSFSAFVRGGEEEGVRGLKS
jgi:hypothetical protein